MINVFKEWRQELCPFCFEYFKLRETPFRCTNEECGRDVDEVLREKWDDARPVGRVLQSEHFVTSVRCECGAVSTKRLCPECHAELPYGTGDVKNYVFAVIGSKEAGKSHYLAVLIRRLKEVVAKRLDMSVEAVTDETMKRYSHDFHDPVYAEKKIIQATQSGSTQRPSPLVYRLTSTKKGKSAVLVFFDTAGEDLNDEDLMSRVNKYIFRSHGIILLIDPLQLRNVRAGLAETPLPEENSETAAILTRTTRLIQKGLNLKPAAAIKIPLAVAISKFDAVKPLVDEQWQQCPLESPPKHGIGFDMLDFQDTHKGLKMLLEKWGENDLVNQVEGRYAKRGFFGLSALGCNPHGTNRIERVRPMRVEDPLLWLLAENGLIKKVTK